MPEITEEVEEVIPSAKRLITSLRDVGYDFVTAVADLVDNSIEAGATKIDIDVIFDGEDSWVRILDNGRGMTPEKILEAMRFGSEREYGENDLGKFGLGMKTASLSQCSRLTVASWNGCENRNTIALCWDLEHIERVNRWEVIRLSEDKLKPVITDALRDNSGTVVLWERLDRILGYKHPYGEHARKCLLTMCRDLETHLAMVFHRFLMGVEGPQIRITLNGNAVQPWDPFARYEQRTQQLAPIRIVLEYEGVTGEIILEPYVLPHMDDFSSPDAFKRAGGPNNWNQQQGFYIYRAGRLIQGGGWCHLRTIDEHTKLARIALRFSPALDEAFKVNVAKRRVQLPGQIQEQVKQAIEPVIRLAQETYRRTPPNSVVRRTNPPVMTTGSGQLVRPGSYPTGMATASRRETVPTDTPVMPEIGSDTGSTQETLDQYWTLEEFSQLLHDVAEPDEYPVVDRLLGRLREALSTSYGDD